MNFLREEIIFPQVNKEAFLASGLAIERGIVLHGPSHGMMEWVMALGNELTKIFSKPTRLFLRTPQDTFSKYSSDGSDFLKNMETSVKKCEEGTPIIIFIQDIHTFYNYCNILDNFNDTTLKQFQSFMSQFLDENTQNEKVFFIASADKTEKVASSLKVPGKFTKFIPFPEKAHEVRKKYLIKSATGKWKIQPEDKIIEEIVKKTETLLPHDFSSLAASAFKFAIKEIIKTKDGDCCKNCRNNSNSLKVDESVLSSINPTMEHWEKALEVVREKIKQREGDKKANNPYRSPSPVKEEASPTIDASTINFSSVGGLDEQIKYLNDNVLMPLKEKEQLKEWGVDPVRGIIFHGPPGTGKTLLAKALATELNTLVTEGESNADDTSKPETKTEAKTEKKKGYTFFYRKATDCFNMYVGQTEKILRDLFAEAEKEAPSVIFFDEFDGLCAKRSDKNIQFYSGIVTTLLGLMDNVKRGQVLVIAATNRLDSLDPAMRRAGRFDRAVGFPIPAKEGRENILKIHTKPWKNGNPEELLKNLAEKTVGFSGADLEQLARQTFHLAMKRKTENKLETLEIQPEDWYKALSQSRPSTRNEKAFGSGATFLQQVPPGVKTLLQQNISTLEKKLEPLLSNMEKTTQSNSNGSGLNSFIVSSSVEAEEVDSLLLPLLLTDSKISKNVATFTLDLNDVLSRQEVVNILEQVVAPPDGKTGIVYVPSVELFFKQTGSSCNPAESSLKEFFITQLMGLRGKNVLILATAKTALKELQTSELYKNIHSIFKVSQDSKCHEYMQPSTEELKSFFNTSLKDFPEQLEFVVKFGLGKEIGLLLDLQGEIQQTLKKIRQSESDEKSKNLAIIEELQKLFKAYETSGSVALRQKKKQFDMYI